VADHVGDRLLQDAVGGLVDSAGQIPGRGGHLELDVQPGLTRHADQLLDLAQPGVGARRSSASRSIPRVARNLLSARALVCSIVTSASCLLGSLVQHMGGDPCLDVDDGDGVGDGVMDLPGDAQPLGVHPPPRLLLLPGPLGPLRPLQRLGRQDPPAADRLAGVAAITAVPMRNSTHPAG
jgi:hypothetical protein